ncbi:hypothetical protein H671_3g10075 [Cricetulus griseus]|uniref:Uncharacterized protein n=1 Tax=Cricetulus griseus TaxID=10029 RepID=A0A061I8M4_CRIGR|nr:hypothetical protein H671_3g10075 [Cricetulus griseus]
MPLHSGTVISWHASSLAEAAAAPLERCSSAKAASSEVTSNRSICFHEGYRYNCTQIPSVQSHREHAAILISGNFLSGNVKTENKLFTTSAHVIAISKPPSVKTVTPVMAV